MRVVIGLDIGGSTTKIIGMADGRVLSHELVKADDPIASAFGALGKFLDSNRLGLADVDRVMVTGVGASFLRGDLLGVRTIRVPEFQAIGLGGLYLSGLHEAVVASMGTGTAFVIARGRDVRHLGGSGVGGGTLLGLANRMLNVRDFQILVDLAAQGNLGAVDLQIADISHDDIPGLRPTATASNFGKWNDAATREDIALGILNLVFQSIGVMAVMLSRGHQDLSVVLTGNLTLVPQSGAIFTDLADLFRTQFIIPADAEYGPAVGAALWDTPAPIGA